MQGCENACLGKSFLHLVRTLTSPSRHVTAAQPRPGLQAFFVLQGRRSAADIEALQQRFASLLEHPVISRYQQPPLHCGSSKQQSDRIDLTAVGVSAAAATTNADANSLWPDLYQPQTVAQVLTD